MNIIPIMTYENLYRLIIFHYPEVRASVILGRNPDNIIKPRASIRFKGRHRLRMTCSSVRVVVVTITASYSQSRASQSASASYT